MRWRENYDYLLSLRDKKNRASRLLVATAVDNRVKPTGNGYTSHHQQLLIFFYKVMVESE